MHYSKVFNGISNTWSCHYEAVNDCNGNDLGFHAIFSEREEILLWQHINQLRRWRFGLGMGALNENNIRCISYSYRLSFTSSRATHPTKANFTHMNHIAFVITMVVVAFVIISVSLHTYNHTLTLLVFGTFDKQNSQLLISQQNC